MKNVILSISLLVSLLCTSQNNLKGKVVDYSVEVTGIAINVDFDNIKELKAFEPEELREILQMSRVGEDVSFKISYNYPNSYKNVKSSSSFSYSITGKSNEPDNFIKIVTELKNRAVKVVSSK